MDAEGLSTNCAGHILCGELECPVMASTRGGLVLVLSVTALQEYRVLLQSRRRRRRAAKASAPRVGGSRGGSSKKGEQQCRAAKE